MKFSVWKKLIIKSELCVSLIVIQFLSYIHKLKVICMFRFNGGIFYLTNTTAGLAILTSLSYFYAGLSKKGYVGIILLLL